MHSVVATRHLADASAVPVLRVALKDMEDEVRLQAYTFIDRREQSISQRIKELQAHLEREGDEPSEDLHARLAQNYWALVEAGLVQGNVRLHMLREAESHLRAAMAGRGSDPGLHFLCGRILLAWEEVDDARVELVDASHFLAEEQPEAVGRALHEHFTPLLR